MDAKQLKILIVEDSEDDALLLIREVTKGGYHASYQRVFTAATMERCLQSSAWDLVITDHNMPNFSSTAALAKVREFGLDVPVIIVSGSIGEDIAVQAMKSGAHDYIMKENLARLVPAIDRELREAQMRADRRKKEATIRHMAYHDSLTNLVNRHELEKRLSMALNMAKERQYSHALLYLDLDQFKIINDTCGHIAGDELLKQLALVLEHLIRDADTLARLGGDEFGVLLENCPLVRAEKIADQLLQAVKNFRFVWQNKPFVIGVSIGLAMINEASANVNEILSQADLACYAAKDMGRNRIHIFDHTDSDLARRQGEMHWVSRINEALDQNRFELFRQAIIPLDEDNDERHFEFLIRLRDIDGSLLPPGSFIPSAERYNLMPAIDRWVIREAFCYLSKKMNEISCTEMALGTCFINLSGASLSDECFFNFIREQRNIFKLPAGLVCFEVTETAAIANLGDAVEFINDIRQEGFLFALDDFGSGLSSFSYLKAIPVDYLKIDGCFVCNMLNDPMDTAIVEAINQIGHIAGLKTIAEFVETQTIKATLKNIGVDYVQGFGIEAPQPLDVT